MLSKIKAYIEKYHMLSPASRVVVGFSGGADSTALVFLLQKLGYSVTAVHIEHGIRGSEALRDAAFTENFCKKYNIEYFVEHLDIPSFAKQHKLSLETAARQERYRVLQEYAKTLRAPLAVAHNKNDQAETILMHLLRGSGLAGLCGMLPVSGNLIRPLLEVSRPEIEAFNKENHLTFIEDSTNYDISFTRNQIRRQLLPLMENINPDAVSAITSCAELLTGYKQLIDKQLEQYTKQLIRKNKNNIELIFADVPYMIKLELIKQALSLLKGNIQDIERVHLESAAELWNKQSGKKVQLPGGITAQKSYGSILFSFNTDPFSAEFAFFPQKSYPWYNNTVISSCFVPETGTHENCEFLDFDALPKSLTLRTRRSGDFLYPLGSNGKCTLKKYFIDKKIPQQKRSQIPLLARDNEILAIIGYTVSSRAAIKNETKNIIKISQGERL